MTYFEESEKETALFIAYIESQSGEPNDKDTDHADLHRAGDKTFGTIV